MGSTVRLTCPGMRWPVLLSRKPCRVSLLSPLLVLAVAGCGSGKPKGVTAAAYTRSICTAVTPFENDVVRRSAALDVSPVSNPVQGKKALQSFLTAVSGDTDRALGELKAAGSPNVPNGKQISAAIVRAFTQLQGAMGRAVTQANALPTNSPKSFQAASQSLGANVRVSMNNIGTNLQSSTVKSPELEKAAARQPACMALNGQS